jgi:hypothetical protein
VRAWAKSRDTMTVTPRIPIEAIRLNIETVGVA